MCCPAHAALPAGCVHLAIFLGWILQKSVEKACIGQAGYRLRHRLCRRGRSVRAFGEPGILEEVSRLAKE